MEKKSEPPMTNAIRKQLAREAAAKPVTKPKPRGKKDASPQSKKS